MTVTQTTRAQAILREQILEGQLAAGTRLLEVPLAAKLEISRTPVRDALARLAEEGLLERARAGGFVVRSFSVSDVVDAIELRGVLEGTAARMAAERGANSDRLAEMEEILGALDDAFDDSASTVDFTAYSRHNARFHDLLSGLSGSDIVRREIARASRLPFAAPTAFLHERTKDDAFRKSLILANEQHHALVSAIAAGEGTRAEAIAREHARVARHNLDHALSQDRSSVRQVPGLALVVDRAEP